jgi:hypothetical protein
MGTELTTIQFSYHSIRTSILRSKQICLPAQPYVDHDCLESARMAMSTLRSIQEAAMTLTDIRSHVAYMHWYALTLLDFTLHRWLTNSGLYCIIH